MTDEIVETDVKEECNDDYAEDEVPTEPETDEEQAALTQFTDEFQPFTEFPEPAMLKMANEVFTGYGKPVLHDEDGRIRPYPCPNWKHDVFSLNDFTELDAYAIDVRTANNI